MIKLLCMIMTIFAGSLVIISCSNSNPLNLDNASESNQTTGEIVFPQYSFKDHYQWDQTPPSEAYDWFRTQGGYGVVLYVNGNFKGDCLYFYGSGHPGDRWYKGDLRGFNFKNVTSSIYVHWCKANFYQHEWCSGTPYTIDARGTSKSVGVVKRGWNDNIESLDFYYQ